MNFDIQVEILKRLPAKSLIQFRSVCKAWKSLIDSSRFIADHNNVGYGQSEHLMVRYEDGYGEERKENYVCFVDDDTFPQKRFAPPVPPIFQSLHRSTIIDGSCGLVCLEGYLRKPDSSEKRMVVLWNPSIRKSIAIVVPNDPPSRFYPFVGFGVCPETKDPKLVKISYNDDQSPCQVMVFTLSSREWRCLSSNQLPRKSLAFKNSCQAVIGRFLYRAAFDGEAYLILSFDLSTDEFGEVPLPDSTLRQSCLLDICKLRESLVLVDYEGGDYTTDDIEVCDVWMLMEDGEFTKLFTIKNASVGGILGFKKTGEPIVEIEVIGDRTVLLAVYEPCLEHVKDLVIGRDGIFFSMCFYNEALLLLDHDDGCIVSCEELNQGN